MSLALAPDGLQPNQSPCFPIFPFPVKLRSLLALAGALTNLQTEEEIQWGQRVVVGSSLAREGDEGLHFGAWRVCLVQHKDPETGLT